MRFLFLERWFLVVVRPGLAEAEVAAEGHYGFRAVQCGARCARLNVAVALQGEKSPAGPVGRRGGAIDLQEPG